MLNKDLFDSAKDAEIAKLKQAIERFKAYDKQRQEYYSSSIQRLGELESYIAELEDSKRSDNLEAVILQQRATIRHLNKLIQVYRIERDRNIQTLDEEITLDNIKRENESLRSQLKSLRKTNKELVRRLIKLES